MDVKNCQQMFLEKKTSWKHFSMVYSLIRPKNNVKNFQVKPLACGSWFTVDSSQSYYRQHFPFSHFKTLSIAPDENQTRPNYLKVWYQLS